MSVTPRSSRSPTACSTSVTVTGCTGSSPAGRTGNRSCSCTAAPAAGRRRSTAGCSTPRGTGSCWSTSATAGAACPTPATRPPTWPPTPPGTWWRTWSGCASTSASTAGRSSAAPGARRSASPMRRRTRSGSASSCCAGSSPCATASSTGSTRAAPPTCFPTSGSASSPRFRSRSAAPGGLIDAYARRLADPDPAVHGPAAVAWATWEAATITLLPRPDLVERNSDPSYALAFARIENHYFVHRGWFEPGQLIRDAPQLAGIPTVLVQGRYDMCTPATTAWDLHRALALGRVPAGRRRRPRLRRAGHPARAPRGHRPLRRVSTRPGSTGHR